MSRGNQREMDRKKQQAKQAALNKGKNPVSGSQLAKSKEDAAAIMRAKQQAAEAKKAESAKK